MTNCYNGYGIKGSFFENVPTNQYKTWTFLKTEKALKILCEGVTVWKVIFGEVSEGCGSMWGQDSVKISFHGSDTASKFYKPIKS